MKSFREYVASRENVNEDLTSMFSDLRYKFDKLGTKDTDKLKMGDHINNFSKVYKKTQPEINKAVKSMKSVNLPNPKANMVMQKHADSLEKDIMNVDKHWYDITSKAVQNKIPVQGIYTP